MGSVFLWNLFVIENKSISVENLVVEAYHLSREKNLMYNCFHPLKVDFDIYSESCVQ